MPPSSLLLLLLGQDGCEKPEDSGVLRSFDCELGLPDASGAFVSLAEKNTVEMQLGFQGFLIIEILARSDDPDVEDVLTGAVSMTPEGMDALGSSGFRVEKSAGVTDPIQVFLDADKLPTYVGKVAHVALRLTGSDAECVAEGDVTLADDDPCIHTGTDPICPDDTGATE